MSIRWLKMGKMSDNMRQDVAKMRKMRDVSSVLSPCRGYGGEQSANSPASRGPGEVPPLGRVNPPPGLTQNPDSEFFAIKVRFSLEASSNFLGSPSYVLRFLAIDLTESR